MNPLSEYFRLIMYPLLVVLCVYATSYFPHFRPLFWSLAVFFGLFGVGLMVLTMGFVEWNTWLRTYLVPLAQALLVASFFRTFWRSHKWSERGDR